MEPDEIKKITGYDITHFSFGCKAALPFIKGTLDAAAQAEQEEIRRKLLEQYQINVPTPLTDEYEYEFGFMTEKEARQRMFGFEDAIANWKASMEQAEQDCNYVGTTVPKEKLAIMHDHAWATDPLGWSRHINHELSEVRRNIANALYWASDLLQDLGNWILGN